MRVFVSSPYSDLSDYREAVADALSRLEAYPGSPIEGGADHEPRLWAWRMPLPLGMLEMEGSERQ